MNHRAPLNLREINDNLKPVGNCDRTSSPGGSVLLPPSGGSSGENLSKTDILRRDALEALHTYICAATGYKLPRSMSVFKRVVTTLDNTLGDAQAEQDA